MGNQVVCCISTLGTGLIMGTKSLTDLLNKIGSEVSMNTFELELRNLTTALFCYFSITSTEVITPLEASEAKMAQALQETEDSILNSIQIVMTVIEEDVQQGILIPRIKNRLQLHLTEAQITFEDHHEDMCWVKNKHRLLVDMTVMKSCPDIDCTWIQDWLLKQFKDKHVKFEPETLALSTL